MRKHATGFWMDGDEHKRAHREPNARTTLCSPNKSVMILLNTSVDRDFLLFPFPFLKNDRELVLINLSAGVM